ncbi:MAG TPA: hypothetical protein VLZ05_10470 [Mycobacterium sp.]|nr:hypothetical protein [Mycobacterium sp.]HUH69255.1 hypothetical protein [Mycobacterium sp.]
MPADVSIPYARRIKRANPQYLVDIPFNYLDSDLAVLGQWARGC